MQDEYPEGLLPDHSEMLLLGGAQVRIASANLTFAHWKGEEIIHNTLGGKPIVNYEGKPMFAELAIVQMAIKVGWSSRWVETYGSRGKAPYYFTNWSDAPLIQQTTKPLDSTYHQELLEKIASLNGRSYAGCWDVLAWTGDRTLFIESKHFKRDTIRDTQIKWLSAGLAAGLVPTNFLIVEWRFAD